MPKGLSPSPALLDAVSRAFKIAVAHREQYAVARELGISPSALSQYINGKKTPRAEVLVKAMDELNLQLEIDGQRFGRAALTPQTRPPEVGVQLKLFNPDPNSTNQKEIDFKIRPGSEKTITMDIHFKLIG